MTSLNYDKVYSRFFNKVEAYDFLELPEDNLYLLLSEWLHSTTSNPYVRKLFKTFSMHDDIQEIKYEIKYSVDEETDMEFLVEILSLGMVVAWLEPKKNSINNLAQVFGSKEEKFYSQSQHLAELRALVKDFKKEQRRMIADRGYVWNTYLSGATRTNEE